MSQLTSTRCGPHHKNLLELLLGVANEWLREQQEVSPCDPAHQPLARLAVQALFFALVVSVEALALEGKVYWIDSFGKIMTI
jgi:hypothetical protein